MGELFSRFFLGSKNNSVAMLCMCHIFFGSFGSHIHF